MSIDFVFFPSDHLNSLLQLIVPVAAGSKSSARGVVEIAVAFEPSALAGSCAAGHSTDRCKFDDWHEVEVVGFGLFGG